MKLKSEREREMKKARYGRRDKFMQGKLEITRQEIMPPRVALAYWLLCRFNGRHVLDGKWRLATAWKRQKELEEDEKYSK